MRTVFMAVAAALAGIALVTAFFTFQGMNNPTMAKFVQGMVCEPDESLLLLTNPATVTTDGTPDTDYYCSNGGLRGEVATARIDQVQMLSVAMPLVLAIGLAGAAIVLGVTSPNKPLDDAHNA